MAFMLSPGVHVTETDLTNVVPAVATSIGGFVGVFQWGPVLDIESIDYQGNLTRKFGKPNDATATSFFSAANFLDYTNQLKVVRVVGANAKNAVSELTGIVTSVTMNAGGEYDGSAKPTVAFSASQNGLTASGTTIMGVQSATISNAGTGYAVNDVLTSNSSSFTVTAVDGTGAITGVSVTDAGSYTTTVGGSIPVAGGTGTAAQLTLTYKVIGVTVVNSGTGYTSASVSFNSTGTVTPAVAIADVLIDTNGLLIKNRNEYEHNYIDGLASIGSFAAKFPGAMGNSIQVVVADKATFATWAYKDNFSNSPNVGETENDELHIIVIDKLGKFSGAKGAILEKYSFLSKAFDSKSTDGTSNYYKNVINKSSDYIYWMDHPINLSTTGDNWGAQKDGTVFKDLTSPLDISLVGGVDDNDVTNESSIIEGWTLFTDPESVDVNLLFVGEANALISKYVIQNIAEVRKDCIVFVSPTRDVCVNNPNVLDDIIAWRNDQSFNVSSSYGALDSGWKYQYDQYNDLYRWVPLNADMAGLHARTDDTNDAWWAAGGLNRGQIKNVVKLSWNPGQMARDQLYQAGINPVTSFQGQGIVLFGNKTLLSKPSAFDRINVRRLFIVLEKAISRAARYMLFEFNDSFTRSQFISMITPYLRMIQGRRGITGFKVVCDETNNTDYIVSTNQFISDIYIKPNYVAEFITLNFVAVNNSAFFTEQG